jgi:hypothetical protein
LVRLKLKPDATYACSPVYRAAILNLWIRRPRFSAT